jgi:hypothetical protein
MFRVLFEGTFTLNLFVNMYPPRAFSEIILQLFIDKSFTKTNDKYKKTFIIKILDHKFGFLFFLILCIF